MQVRHPGNLRCHAPLTLCADHRDPEPDPVSVPTPTLPPPQGPGEPGPRDVRLRTRYIATFTVAGSAATYTYTATGVAKVGGPATGLEVVEAHSELIAGDRVRGRCPTQPR